MTKQYLYHEDSQAVEVTREDWRWVATYDDGTVVRQFEGMTGRFRRFAEIDQTRLKQFQMVSDHLPTHTLLFDPATMALVHFYRTKVFRAGLPDEHRYRIYCFGYKTKDREHAVGIFPGGDSITKDSFEAIDGDENGNPI